MEVLAVVAGAQAAYAAVLAWLWEIHDRRWKHIPKRVRTALFVGAAVLAPHALVLMFLVTKYAQLRRRRGRVYAALMDMNRRRDTRAAGERCPACGEYHG